MPTYSFDYDDDERDDQQKSVCCLGQPGTIYLVGCLVPSYPRKASPSTGEYYIKWKGPQLKSDDDDEEEWTFEDRCMAVDSICGGSCGVDVAAPKGCEKVEEDEDADDEADEAERRLLANLYGTNSPEVANHRKLKAKPKYKIPVSKPIEP